MELLNEFLKRNREKKLDIHCVGDAMIDEYYEVKVNRISPEFPMPIMTSENDTPVRRPGGAANVACQLKYFNVKTQLICWCNKLLMDVLDDAMYKEKHNYSAIGKFNYWGPIIGCGGPNCVLLPIKKRFLDNGVQVTRHDIETPLCGLDEHAIAYGAKQISDGLSLMPKSDAKPDVAILSDYNKGFFSSEEFNILDSYRDVVTIVDPKKGPINKWRGCTIFKLNAKEACELTGKKQWKEQAKQLQFELECKAVVITFGADKVCGISGEDFFSFIPERKVVVESVVGAGDCFAAFFAMAIGHGFTIVEAAEIAWHAGSNYVMHRRNEPITPSELSVDRVIEPADLVDRNFKLVLTNGCFDLLHSGHIKTLEFAKSKGDKLVVALNSDASVKKLKGETRPIMPLEQRMAVMASLKMVDFVVSFDEDTPLELIKLIKPDVLVKGSDYKDGEIVGEDLVPETFRCPIIKGLSSSNFVR